MKFTGTKENLYRGLSLVGSLAQKNAHLPVLNHVLLEATDKNLRAVTTNLEIAIVANIRAVVDLDGAITVPAKTLMDYVGLLNTDTVNCELIETELKVKGGRSTTKIKGVAASEFPLIPPVKETGHYTVSRKNFIEAATQVVYAASHSEARPELQGVLFNFRSTNGEQELVLAATDSYRLAEGVCPVTGEGGERRIIVPSRTVFEAMRIAQILKDEEKADTVEIFPGEGQIKIVCGSVEITSRLIEGNYPDYTQIIPQKFDTEVTTEGGTLVNAVKAASLFTANGINAVSITANENGGLTIASMSSQLGEHETTVDAAVSGKQNSIVLNFRYLLDALGALDGSEIEIKIVNSETPCVIRAKGNDKARAIIMPIRQ